MVLLRLTNLLMKVRYMDTPIVRGRGVVGVIMQRIYSASKRSRNNECTTHSVCITADGFQTKVRGMDTSKEESNTGYTVYMQARILMKSSVTLLR